MNKLWKISFLLLISMDFVFAIPKGKPGYNAQKQREKKEILKQKEHDEWERTKYLAMSSCEKQDVLWQKVLESEHKELPKLSKLGILEVLGLGTQAIGKKIYKQTDFAPRKWKKYLHKRGAVAKVKFTAIGNNAYTGLFKGAECALLRLSLTYRPQKSKDKPFAPGLALKVLRNNAHSANVSALYTLSGQGFNYNFFENPLSNIVPRGSSIGEKLIHLIFNKVAKYPEELRMEDFSIQDEEGKYVKTASAPRQLFFVPNKELSFSTSKHDFREDLLTLKSGTLLYDVYALGSEDKDSFYDYKIDDIKERVEKATKIGELKTTSDFKASEFGDVGIFFRHQVKVNEEESLK